MILVDCIQQLKDYDEARMKYPMLGQVKMDGIFGRWDPVTKRFYTRSGNVIQGLSVLEAELTTVNIPLDGELVIPNKDFFTMNGLIRSFNETPTCMYYVFDAPDSTNTYQDRVDIYTGMFTTGPCEHVKPMRVHVLENRADTVVFHEKVIAKGHEGTVYKQPLAKYIHGKHWHQMKDVPTKTCECTIVSAYEGLGKLKGKLGGFIVDFKGTWVKVGGGPGITEDVRARVWKERVSFIGKPLKCQYKKLTPNGSMRSPQMLGIRWDI